MDKNEKLRNNADPLILPVEYPPPDRFQKYSNGKVDQRFPLLLPAIHGIINSFKISPKFRAIRCAIKSYTVLMH